MSNSDMPNKPVGYWKMVARDGQKMGFWFVLPALLLLIFNSFSKC